LLIYVTIVPENPNTTAPTSEASKGHRKLLHKRYMPIIPQEHHESLCA
jgi:hypothetical protein